MNYTETQQNELGKRTKTALAHAHVSRMERRTEQFEQGGGSSWRAMGEQWSCGHDCLLVKSDSRRGESGRRLEELVRRQGPRSVSQYVLLYPLSSPQPEKVQGKPLRYVQEGIDQAGRARPNGSSRAQAG